MTPPRGRSELTGRQRDVVALVARGLSNKEIGTELGIAIETVKNHVASAFRFTGVENRTELAMWWVAQHAEPEPKARRTFPRLLLVAVVMAQALDLATFMAMPRANEVNPIAASMHTEAAWLVKALLVVLVVAIQPALDPAVSRPWRVPLLRRLPRIPASTFRVVGEAVALLALAAGCIGAGSNLSVLAAR